MTTFEFDLSVVATSRNDNHGGSLTYRMQHFVDGFIAQCKRHNLKAELILVEWNPPKDRPPLVEALNFPQDKGPCAIRIITVPREVHDKLMCADQLPLFQMIGKNVGIRRAKGKFIVATNIDILFSDELIKFMRDQLEPGHLYRADRFDVPPELPKADSLDETLEFCKEHYFRINGKFGTKIRGNRKVIDFILWGTQIAIRICRRLKKLTKKNLKGLAKIRVALLVSQMKQALMQLKQALMRFQRLHTNACGDFTLLSYQDWMDLRGYPEWEIFSFHIDSVLLFQAQQHHIKEIDLPKQFSLYHIEHGKGSGYTPEGADVLFKRLEEKKIPYLRNEDFDEIVRGLRTSKEKVVYNSENWGMSNLNLDELVVEGKGCCLR